MAFPAVDWGKIKVDVSAVMAAQGTDADFTLRDGQTGTIKVAQGRLRDEDLTDGLQQKGFRLRCMADDWDGAFTRSPEKGDRVELWGRRHSISSALHRGAADESLMYILVVLG